MFKLFFSFSWFKFSSLSFCSVFILLVCSSICFTWLSKSFFKLLLSSSKFKLLCPPRGQK
ncbi:hypothetical protein MSU_0746 [Mycoplasma suis str. Illinois]|uniref:Uncharacterized protein n=1 Tax=Mycoplasma suis (strain Illinois) TaxID=768700 RepID=F0QS01_MYCSL|nr:hypothetical protein MSU_0746 [Mycoplasma suis str. Illinois]